MQAYTPVEVLADETRRVGYACYATTEQALF